MDIGYRIAGSVLVVKNFDEANMRIFIMPAVCKFIIGLI